MLNTSKKILDALDIQERIKISPDTVVIRYLILTGRDIRQSIITNHIRYGRMSYQTHHDVRLSRTLLGAKGFDVLLEEANNYFSSADGKTKGVHKTYGSLHKGACPNCNDGYGECKYPFEGLMSDSGYKFEHVSTDGIAIINDKVPLGFRIQQLVEATDWHPKDVKGIYNFCRFCGRRKLNEAEAKLEYHNIFKLQHPAVHPRTNYAVRDSMNEATLGVVLSDDGDVIVSLTRKGTTSRTANTDITQSAHFCTLRGGGRSLRTRNALIELARAIIEDEKETPTIVE